MKLIDQQTTPYLVFKRYLYPNKKTYDVEVNNQQGLELGVIKWRAGWRRYCFYPCVDTVYDSLCMKHISQYIDDLMQQRKKG